MPMTLEHIWTCDVCGRVLRAELNFWPPRGWNYIDGKLVCPQHEITIGKAGEAGDPSLAEIEARSGNAALMHGIPPEGSDV